MRSTRGLKQRREREFTGSRNESVWLAAPTRTIKDAKIKGVFQEDFLLDGSISGLKEGGGGEEEEGREEEEVVLEEGRRVEADALVGEEEEGRLEKVEGV